MRPSGLRDQRSAKRAVLDVAWSDASWYTGVMVTSLTDDVIAEGARERIDRILQLLSEYLISGEDARMRYRAFLRASSERQRFILDLLDDHFGDTTSEHVHLQSLERRQHSAFENFATFVSEFIDAGDNADHMGPRAQLLQSAISHVIDLTDPADVPITTSRVDPDGAV